MDLNKVTILNGATGTELIKYGFNGTHQEKWILEHENIMKEIQNSYVSSGTQVIYTPTFETNYAKLKLQGEENKLEYYNEALFNIAKSSGAIIWGDLGPSSLFTKPLGKASEEDIFNIYKGQAEILEKCGVDAFIIETMMTLEDTVNAVKAVKSVSSKQIIVSCSCDKRGRLLTGTNVIDVLRETEKLGIDAFGLNCSVGPRDMLEQIKIIHEHTKLPLLAKPNAGLPVIRNGKTVYDCTPTEFASYAKAFIENGVTLIGGCCGTTAEHIKLLKNTLI